MFISLVFITIDFRRAVNVPQLVNLAVCMFTGRWNDEHMKTVTNHNVTETVTPPWGK